MPTLFTRIIDGEVPGHFVWRDPQCVAFLSINPTHEGHTLVVPRLEVDHWLDAPVELTQHLVSVAHSVGRAQMAVFSPLRTGLVVAGLEVPHLHLHVIPMNSMADLDFRNARHDAGTEELAGIARRLRDALRERGHAEADASS